MRARGPGMGRAGGFAWSGQRVGVGERRARERIGRRVDAAERDSPARAPSGGHTSPDAMFPALRPNGIARWLAVVLALYGLAAGLLLSLALAEGVKRGR